MQKSGERYDQYYNEDEKASKRSKMKKMLIAIVSIIVVIIVVVLCVVFLVILKSDDHNNPDYPGYKISNVVRNDSNGLEIQLQYLGNNDYYVNNQKSPILKNVTFSASFDSNEELTIKYTDSNKTRFRLPDQAPFPFTKSDLNTNLNPNFEVQVSFNPFSVTIIRKSTNESIFNNKDLNFVYSDRYLEISTYLPTHYLYGLGERRQDFLYYPGTFTIWPKDQYATIDNGTGPSHQTYGHQPMYLMREQSGNYHVVFLRNSHAMDCIVSGSSKVLTYKITGGIMEFKIFLGDKMPDTSLKLYHHYLNGYTMMPFWSLGYHQSRWGYKSSKALLEVVNNFSTYDIPLDTIWSDIDYLDQYQDFTVNSNFTRDDFDTILNKSIHWVPILDIGIYRDNTSGSAYQKANDSDTFIKSYFTEAPLLACVWPGMVSYPDFNHPNASKFWGEQLGLLHEKLPFSGIWLDMNEPSNFVEGEVLNESYHCLKPGESNPTNRRLLQEDNFNKKMFPKLESFDNMQDSGHSTDNLYIYSNDLPYIPGNLPLENKTLSMNATHYYQGVYLQSSEVITEMDFHSLNGFLEAKTTYDYLKQNLSQQLPFILSRSNLFGSGAFHFHWTGDNYADWIYLKTSISEIFNFQLFGIPFTGVDLCGFGGNTTEELCTRFMQAGALYPFSRNHNSIDAISQEPYAWGQNSTVFKATQKSLKLRYSILKWYYSVFVRNNGTGSVFRPLFFEFPDDIFLNQLQDQFLIGSEIMVAPVLDNDEIPHTVYFTNNTSWFDFFNGSINYQTQGKFVRVDAPLDSTAPLFIRAGSIIFTQNTTNVTKVADLSNYFKLKIALDSNLTANGWILGINDYTNDSNVINSCTNQNDCLIQITAVGTKIDDYDITVNVTFEKNTPNSILQEIYITEVEVFGVQFGHSYQTIEYNLTQSFLVQDKSLFSFSHVFNSFYKLSSHTFDGQKFVGTLDYQGLDDFFQKNSLCPIVKHLNLTITYDSKQELTILIDDSSNKRFTLPYNKPFPFTKTVSFTGSPNFYYDIPSSDRFSLRIIRNSTNEVIFDTTGFLFIYSDHYLEISTILPSKYLYGLGERRQGFLYQDGIYTIWPKDQYEMMDGGQGPNHQTYGQHPVYLMRENSGNFDMVFLRNHHGIDFQVSQGVSKLTYKTVGGVFEFKIFIGDQKPDTVLKAYHAYLNGYTVMPFWSLGYHQSRWGYNSSAMMLEVVKNFAQYDIPLDTIWSDIDYMDKFEDFTFGPTFFKSDFDLIRNNYSVNWVPILDIGIAKGDGNNSAYNEGLSQNVYVTSSVYPNKPLMNCVWPGKVSYPDFNHPNASIFWKKQLAQLYSKMPFDGLWLDMNEPSAFVEGEIDPNKDCPPTPMPSPPNARLLAEYGSIKSVSDFYSMDLPYIPGLVPLEANCISMNSTHISDGAYISKQGDFTEFDYHGLSGYLESLITHDFLTQELSQPLPFILSRNTLFSQGAFSFHWTGDNLADWTFFQTSISEIFNFQLFGIPLSGVDLCGFGGNTTEQLCSRWMQAGAFFPFSRNHNQIYLINQEPYAWGANSTVYKASQQSLKLRYSIMKWYYSIFVRNNGTGSVFRPLFFDFQEVEALTVEDQFLLGSEIMVAPVVKENATSRNIYFPGQGLWFDFVNNSNFYNGGLSREVLNALDTTPPIFQKAGTIIYVQNSTLVRNVKDLDSSNKFTLKIALSRNDTANTFYADGYMMGIQNYTDSEAVSNFCLGLSNCLLTISASGFLDQNNKLNLTITFNGTTQSTNVQENYISRLDVVGIEKSIGVYSNAILDLATPFTISNGQSMNYLV